MKKLIHILLFVLLLSFITCGIIHPIKKYETDNVKRVAIKYETYKRLTYEDEFGSVSLNPDAPYSIEVLLTLNLLCPNFMELGWQDGKPYSLNTEITINSEYIYDIKFDLNMDPKESRIGILSFTILNREEYFNELWNKGINKVDIRILKTNIHMKTITWFSIIYYVSYLISLGFICFSIGLFLVAGNGFLHEFYVDSSSWVKVVMWIVFFPFIIFIVAGNKNPIPDGCEILYNEKGNRIGYYDPDKNAYYDLSSRLRTKESLEKNYK